MPSTYLAGEICLRDSECKKGKQLEIKIALSGEREGKKRDDGVYNKRKGA